MNIKEQFGHLFEPDLLSQIATKGHFAEVKEGEVLLDSGDLIRTIPLIISGSVKVIRVNENGGELLLYYISCGDTCAMTITCCMERHPSEIRAIAEDEVALIAIPVDLLDLWLVTYRTWRSFIMRSIRSRFLELINTVDLVAFQKLDERLILYLKEKSKISKSMLLNVSHQQIADELATSRVVISRLLKALEADKKVLLFRNQVRIIASL